MPEMRPATARERHIGALGDARKRGQQMACGVGESEELGVDGDKAGTPQTVCRGQPRELSAIFPSA